MFNEPDIAVRPGRDAVIAGLAAGGEAVGELGDHAFRRDPPKRTAKVDEPLVAVRAGRDGRAAGDDLGVTGRALRG
jgi:hypothetical protein